MLTYTPTHTHSHIHRDKVIVISLPLYYVVGVDNQQSSTNVDSQINSLAVQSVMIAQ